MALSNFSTFFFSFFYIHKKTYSMYVRAARSDLDYKIIVYIVYIRSVIFCASYLGTSTTTPYMVVENRCDALSSFAELCRSADGVSQYGVPTMTRSLQWPPFRKPVSSLRPPCVFRMNFTCLFSSPLSDYPCVQPEQSGKYDICLIREKL